MADANIDYNCGCGFKTKRLEEAKKHSDSADHRMTVLGTINPVKEVPTAGITEPLKPLPVDTSDIEALRKKLGKTK